MGMTKEFGNMLLSCLFKVFFLATVLLDIVNIDLSTCVYCFPGNNNSFPAISNCSHPTIPPIYRFYPGRPYCLFRCNFPSESHIPRFACSPHYLVSQFFFYLYMNYLPSDFSSVSQFQVTRQLLVLCILCDTCILPEITHLACKQYQYQS